jgi:hypothetical protein
MDEVASCQSQISAKGKSCANLISDTDTRNHIILSAKVKVNSFFNITFAGVEPETLCTQKIG